MNTKLTVAVLSVAVLVLVGCGGNEPRDESLTGELADLMPAEPQQSDAQQEAPEQTVVLHADPYVVVSAVTLAPGDELPDHRGEDRIAYVTLGGNLRLVQDGDPRSHALEEGEVLAIDNGATTFVNDGDSPLAVVLFSRSAVDVPELPAGVPPFDAERVGDGAEVLLETEAAVVYRAGLDPGDTLPIPGAPLWAIYADTDTAVLTMRGADLEPDPLLLDVGDAHVSEKTTTEIENVGEEPTSLLLVVYRETAPPEVA